VLRDAGAEPGTPTATLVVMAQGFDLWLDYHRRDGDGLTHAHVDDVVTDVHLVPGTFVVVGNAEADPAVAEVIAVEDDGVVLVRVLAGPVEEHQHRVRHLHQAG
jgi:hypothetical protein